MSVAVIVSLLGQNTPTSVAASLVAFESPDCTLTSVEAFLASIDVAPADTEPRTCPATPSPVVAVDAWSAVRRLLPSCASQGFAVVMSAVTVKGLGQLNPAKLAASLAAKASPVVASTVVESLAATIEFEPPADVTAPMICPPTPSPDVAAAF